MPDEPAPAVTIPSGGPSVDDPSARCVRAEETEFAHTNLLAAYLDVIREASLITWDPKRSTELSLRQRYAIRKFAEGHIKRRLQQLATIYKQMSSATAHAESRAWFAQATQSCESFASTLSFGRVPTTLALLPLVISLVGGAVDEISWTDPILYVLGLPLLIAGYHFSLARDDFERKRSLFCEGGVSDQSAEDEAEPPRVRNIYLLEDDLFARLGRGKPLEAPMDFVALALALLTGCAGVGLLITEWIIAGPVIWTAICALVVYGAAVYGRHQLRGRRWR